MVTWHPLVLVSPPGEEERRQQGEHSSLTFLCHRDWKCSGWHRLETIFRLSLLWAGPLSCVTTLYVHSDHANVISGSESMLCCMPVMWILWRMSSVKTLFLLLLVSRLVPGWWGSNKARHGKSPPSLASRDTSLIHHASVTMSRDLIWSGLSLLVLYQQLIRQIKTSLRL